MTQTWCAPFTIHHLVSELKIILPKSCFCRLFIIITKFTTFSKLWPNMQFLFFSKLSKTFKDQIWTLCTRWGHIMPQMAMYQSLWWWPCRKLTCRVWATHGATYCPRRPCTQAYESDNSPCHKVPHTASDSHVPKPMMVTIAHVIRCHILPQIAMYQSLWGDDSPCHKVPHTAPDSHVPEPMMVTIAHVIRCHILPQIAMYQSLWWWQ